MDQAHNKFEREQPALADAHSPTINQALRRELLDLMAADQECRKSLAAKYAPGQPFSPADMELALSVDDAGTERLRAVLGQHGWPGRSLVGRDGATAAWLLAQHADRHPDFQRRCLNLLSRAVSAGEAEGREFAYLLDRVRLHAGQPQVFGTQLNIEGGQVRPFDLIEAHSVDHRRALVGLPPLAEYIGFAQEQLAERNTTVHSDD